MKLIDKKTADALANLKSFRKTGSGATSVVTCCQAGLTKEATVYLHGNPIFTWRPGDKNWEFDDCGWTTPTTCNRINACLEKLNVGLRLRQKAREHVIVDAVSGTIIAESGSASGFVGQ